MPNRRGVSHLSGESSCEGTCSQDRAFAIRIKRVGLHYIDVFKEPITKTSSWFNHPRKNGQKNLFPAEVGLTPNRRGVSHLSGESSCEGTCSQDRAFAIRIKRVGLHYIDVFKEPITKTISWFNHPRKNGQKNLFPAEVGLGLSRSKTSQLFLGRVTFRITPYL